MLLAAMIPSAAFAQANLIGSDPAEVGIEPASAAAQPVGQG